MSDTLSTAFGHPLERAQALDLPDIQDRISLRNHIRTVEIGAFEVERDVTQRLSFDVVVEVGVPDRSEAALADDVDKILSYDAITEAIERGLSHERLNLLETLAERIADDILSSPLAKRVFLRIEKLDRGPGKLGVEIVRDQPRADSRLAGPELSADIVFIAADVADDPRISAVIDRLLEGGKPKLLCLDFPAERPRSASADAQRRIDLLALEQNAWRLAGRDDRVSVAATRTEMDWSLKRQGLCVWAPSKMVLDAVDKTAPMTIDPEVLSLWIGKQFNVENFIGIYSNLTKMKTNSGIRPISLEKFLNES